MTTPNTAPSKPSKDTILTAHAFSSSEFDEMCGLTGETLATVRWWCFAAHTNEPVVVTIKGVKPWCFVELPEYFIPDGVETRKQRWTPILAQELVEEMRRCLGPTREEPAKIVSGELVEKSKLYYYQPKENAFHMLKLTFDSLAAMRTVASKIESAAWLPPDAGTNPARRAPQPRGRFYGKRFGRLVLRCWEHDISLRRKINTILELKVAQWFDLKPFLSSRGDLIPRVIHASDPDSAFTCTEYMVTLRGSKMWNKMFVALTDEQVSTRNIPASAPKELGYDIETYTDNHRAFPDAMNDAHCVTMITCVTQRARDPASQRRIIITTRAASISSDMQHEAYTSTNTRIDEFIAVPNEAAMLEAFADVIEREDPDIITGYNINGYDAAYLDTRYRLQCSATGAWPAGMSRVRGDDKVIMENRKWFSKGTGTVESTVIKMEGRLTIDLMPLIKRDHKIIKYNLDTVAKHFNVGGKHDVDAKQMFVAYEAAVRTHAAVEAGVLEADSTDRLAAIAEMTRVAAYGVQDSVLVVDLFEKLNVWLGLVELSSVTGVTIAETYSRGQQCRVVSLLYDLASPKNIVLDKRRLPAPRPKDDAAPTDDDSIIKYTGGYVGQPVVGLHENVLCMDFASLYPSIIIARNIDFRTLLIDSSPLEHRAFSGKVAAHDAALAKANPGNGYVNAADTARLTDRRYSCASINKQVEKWSTIEFEEAGSGAGDPHVNDASDNQPAWLGGDAEPAGESDGDDEPEVPQGGTAGAATKYAFKYVKPEEFPGLLPTLVKGLIDERKRIRGIYAGIVRKLRELPDGSTPEASQLKLQAEVLNQRQLAIKVTANSVYGVVGAQRAGSYSLVEGAMSVTAYGRQLIKEVYAYVQTTYGGRIIGGDTDSCFFQLPEQVKTLKDANEWGARLAKELTALFPPPLAVEFEKAMRMLAFKKKMYAALQVNDAGTGYKPDMLVRGIVLARRDKCKFLTSTYEPLLRHALHGGGIVDGLKIVQLAIEKALAAKPSPEMADDFEVVNSVGAVYKQVAYRINVFAAECSKAGFPVRAGDRVGYVIVKDPSSVPEPGSVVKPENLGLRMRLTEVWKAGLDADPPSSPIDAFYYIEHWCQSPLDQLLKVAYGDEMQRLGVARAVSFQPRSNVLYASDEPIRMFCAIMRHTNTRRAKNKAAAWTGAEMAEAFALIVSNIAKVHSESSAAAT